MSTKKMKVRQVVVFLLVAMLIATACSGNNNGGNQGTNGNQPGNQTQTDGNGNANEPNAPANIGEQPDPVELTIHGWFISPSIQATIDLFMEEHPWITIKHNASINGYIINNIIAGEDSDIIFLDAGLSQWISGGNDLLVELTPFIDQDERIQNANLNEGVLESHKVGDKIYTMPYSDIPMWIAVNKELLDQYGLDMPSNDWTYDDMLQLAKSATDRNANTWGMYGVTSWFMHTLPVANGNAENFRLLGEGNLKSVADTPGVIADMQWLQDLIIKENVQPNADQVAELGIKSDTGAAFVDGNILFAAIADWDLATLERATFEWDVLPFPAGRERQVTFRHIGSAAITKASKDQEEAFMFLSYLFTEGAQKAMIENGSAAWVQTPELDNYYDEVPIWQGRNTEVVKMSAKMGQYSTDPSVMNLVELNSGVNNRVTNIINSGGNFSDVIPFVEEYNRLAEETRAAMGITQ